jgi:hypothetical protein
MKCIECDVLNIIVSSATDFFSFLMKLIKKFLPKILFLMKLMFTGMLSNVFKKIVKLKFYFKIDV